MRLERASGILLHPSSFPSTGGIGDFGPAAYEFLEFLSAARQRVWQVLPLNPIGMGDSPYSSISAFAGNPLLISLERLSRRGWIPPADHSDTAGNVDFDKVRRHKLPLLEEAARSFLRDAPDGYRRRYEQFSGDAGWWLDDYALFAVLKRRYNGQSWHLWPEELTRRSAEALAGARAELGQELEIEKAIQFFFFEQFGALRRACSERRIRLLGDIAIFVNYDSADVWTHPEIFRLDQALRPEVVAGVPPDAFSETGQYWGNPLYRWDVLRREGYRWWRQRIGWSLRLFDLIRLDHFRGFESYWEIPAHHQTAVHGRWIPGPADEFFHSLASALGELPLIAEDLGMITAEVHALRDRLAIPGMKVLQFGFSNPGAHIYLPHKFEPNCIVYTGTHDNDTTVGWWMNLASDYEREQARSYLGEASDGIHWAFIRAGEASVADLCVIPLQDVLGLGSECRMNTPSRQEGNWAWRYRPGALRPELVVKLRALTEITDRAGAAPSAAGEQRYGEGAEDFAA